MNTLRSLAIPSIVTVLFLGCISPTTTPVPTTVTVAPLSPPIVVVEDPFEAFAGDYTIGGAPVVDGCGGRIVLAARNIRVDPSTRTLYADVVDRTYEARIESGQLIAEGRFPARAACQSSTIFERWTLTQNAAGGLDGTLTSLWMLPPNCSHPCQISFVITTTPH